MNNNIFFAFCYSNICWTTFEWLFPQKPQKQSQGLYFQFSCHVENLSLYFCKILTDVNVSINSESSENKRIWMNTFLMAVFNAFFILFEFFLSTTTQIFSPNNQIIKHEQKQKSFSFHSIANKIFSRKTYTLHLLRQNFHCFYD